MLCHMLHQILGIVDTYREEPLLLIYAKQDRTALILVGEAGQRIVQAGGTALGGGFHFLYYNSNSEKEQVKYVGP